MAKTKTYAVIYERDEKDLWVAHVKGVAGCHTQGRTIAQARDRIREALALFDEHAMRAEFLDHFGAVATRRNGAIENDGPSRTLSLTRVLYLLRL